MGTAATCPVCKARFRRTRVCSRCGADLAPLMLLATLAWRLRQAARRALAEGRVTQARALASEAQRLHRTNAGEALRAVSAWLATEPLGR